MLFPSSGDGGIGKPEKSVDSMDAPYKWIHLNNFFYRICFSFFLGAGKVLISVLWKGCSECFVQGLVGVVGCAKDCFCSSCTSKWWFEPGDGVHGLWNRYHCACWCLQQGDCNSLQSSILSSNFTRAACLL